MAKKKRKDNTVGKKPGGVPGAPVEIDGLVESMRAEVEEIRALRREYKRLYDEVRVRVNGFQHLAESLEAAIGIMDSAIKVHKKTGSEGETDDKEAPQNGRENKPNE